MSQKKQVLLRTCRKCKKPVATTAAGIKQHAEGCAGADTQPGIIITGVK